MEGLEARAKRRLALLGFGLAAVLLGLKAWAAALSGSVAILSDALNSLLDVIAYALLFIGVTVHHFPSDPEHPFGHRRAEPIASLLLSFFALVLGVATLRQALLASNSAPAEAPFAFAAGLLATGASMVGKAAMSLLYARQHRAQPSPAMQAAAVDSRNDVLTSALALGGFWLGGTFDRLAGLLIGGWIIWSGVQVGWLNIGYLMGRSPDAVFLERARRSAEAVPGVLGVHDLRAHHIGDVVHIEIHVEIDKHLTSLEAHDIGRQVSRRLEEDPEVDRAFVHIDPV